MSTIIRNLFVVAVLVALVYAALFVLTIRLTGFRFWPPPQARSWQFFFAWKLINQRFENHSSTGRRPRWLAGGYRRERRGETW